MKPAAKAAAKPAKTPAVPRAAKATASIKKSNTPKLQDIFLGAGFTHVPADGIHIDFMGRTGELDHIFVWQNVVLLCEETADKGATKHCTNKIHFHKQIASNWLRFYKEFGAMNPALVAAVEPAYKANELEVRHVYYSEVIDIVDSVGDPSPFHILTRAQASYFGSLVDTIHKSAKYELLKYLDINLSQVGTNRVRGSGVSSDGFQAFAMPSSHTNYPADFAVVSFYADPLSLIERAYVMRRDGWEDPDLSYQRFVKAEKLLDMREYLRNDGTVFITNLIVTLPSSSVIKNAQGAVIDPKALTKKSTVTLELPLELGTIGIVDGQHRVFSYYEGHGPSDAAIDALSKRQNLLVTGIIFPATYTPEMRVQFEASIFLGINNNQSPVPPQLRQDLEMIINPETPLATARAVVIRLSKEGPLAGLLQLSQFDPSDKIATGSLAPYVLKTLMKSRGALYKLWDPAGDRDLANEVDRKAYIEFTVAHLKRLLQGASFNMKDRWKSVANGGVLSTTAVGGMLMSLDRFAQEKKCNRPAMTS